MLNLCCNDMTIFQKIRPFCLSFSLFFVTALRFLFCRSLHGRFYRPVIRFCPTGSEINLFLFTAQSVRYSFSRFLSTASFALTAVRYSPEGLPYSSFRYGSIASNTSGRNRSRGSIIQINHRRTNLSFFCFYSAGSGFLFTSFPLYSLIDLSGSYIQENPSPGVSMSYKKNHFYRNSDSHLFRISLQNSGVL